MAQNSQLIPLPDSQQLKIYAPENKRYQFKVGSQAPMFKGDVSFQEGYLPPPTHPKCQSQKQYCTFFRFGNPNY